MASTRHNRTSPIFFSMLTLMLLSAAQGVNSYGRGEWSDNNGKVLCFYALEKESFFISRPMKVSDGKKMTTSRFDNADEYVVSTELLQQWKQLYTKIREEEKLVQNLFRDATNAQFKAGTLLRNVELKKDMIDPVQIAALQAAFDKSVADLKKANLQQKEIKKLVEKSRKINAKPGSLTEKKVDGMRTVYNEYLARYRPEQPPVADPVVSTPTTAPPPVPATVQTKPTTQIKQTSEEKPTSQAKASQEKLIAQEKPASQEKPKGAEDKTKQARIESEPIAYDPDMVNKRPGHHKPSKYLSQPYHCNFELDTIDPATGMIRKALKPNVLFTHTDPDLKPFFRGKDLITCLGRVARSGSYVQLTIEFQIASSHSQNNFGTLEEGSLLRFKLMNDEYISLFNLKTNMGHIDPYTGYTIFSGQYALGKQEINKLSTVELDKMRVLWSTGFEDYDVYHIDFLINQLNCLMSK